MTEAITAEHLYFSYDQAEVLSDVCFSVKEGEFIGVIGPNGGGKTTLLQLLTGFLMPSKGTLKVFNEKPSQAQKWMAYVPQNMRFDRHFPISVMELVLGGRLAHLPWYGVYHKKDKEIALDALDQIGLAHLKDRAFGTLSGGQQQRCLIARALASQPKILFLDEPTANVDNDAEYEILNLLQGLKGKMTILMVTHDLQTAINHVDRVICVQQNAVTYSPVEVCEHYALGLYHPPLLTLKSKLENKIDV
jgi:zinc transport system ATP-binding protein